MDIRIFGPGCSNCQRLAETTRDALDALGYRYRLEKVEEVAAIAAAGVLRTPALEVNGRLVLQGRVPGSTEMRRILEKAVS